MTAPNAAGGAGLSAAQAELLRDIGRRPVRTVGSYKPAQRLIALGYATGEGQERPFALLVTITAAGRAALASDEGRTGR